MKKELTSKDIAKFADAAKQSNIEIISRAVRANGLNACAVDPEEKAKLPMVFDIELDTGSVTNQKRSGRCWMFAGLNVLRAELAKKLNVKEIELSQAYLQFYDKLEKANFFLERAIENAAKSASDRINSFLLENTVMDGGHWAFFASLVRKYGVVPSQVMKDTAVSCETAELNGVLARLMADDMKIFHDMSKAGKTEEDMRKKKSQMLSDVYRVLAICLGTPCTEFRFDYTDKDKKAVHLGTMTPKEFAERYIGNVLDDYVTLADAPYEGWAEGTKTTTRWVGSVEGGDPVVYYNAGIQTMKKAVIASLKEGEVVWFAGDVRRSCLRASGFLGTDVLKVNELLGIKEKNGKGDRLDYRTSVVSHAMAFTGVAFENGKPVRYKVENTWGSENGQNGYYVMDDSWFNEYVYQIFVKKERVPSEVLEAFDHAKTQCVDPFCTAWEMMD